MKRIGTLHFAMLAALGLLAASTAFAAPGANWDKNVTTAEGEPSPLGYWSGTMKCGDAKGPVDVGVYYDWRTAKVMAGLQVRPVASGMSGPRSPVSDYIGRKMGRPPARAPLDYDAATKTGTTRTDPVSFGEDGKRHSLNLTFTFKPEEGVLVARLPDLPECGETVFGKKFVMASDGTRRWVGGQLENSDAFLPSSMESFWKGNPAPVYADGEARELGFRTLAYVDGFRLDMVGKDFCYPPVARLYLSTPYGELMSRVPGEKVAQAVNTLLPLWCPSATSLDIEYRLRSTPESVLGPVRRLDVAGLASVPSLTDEEVSRLDAETASAAEALVGVNAARANLSRWLGELPGTVFDGIDFVTAVRELDRLDGLQLPEEWTDPCAPDSITYAETNRYRFKEEMLGDPHMTAGYLQAHWDCDRHDVSLIVEANESVPLEHRTAWNGKDPVFGTAYSCVFDRQEELIQICMANPSTADFSNAEENGCLPAVSSGKARLASCADPASIARRSRSMRIDYKYFRLMNEAFQGFARGVLSSRVDECLLTPEVTTGAGGQNVVLGYSQSCD